MIIRKRPREKFLRRVPRYWSDVREHRRRIREREQARSFPSLAAQSLDGTDDALPEVGSIDMSRTFTVTEAEALLPVLEALLRSAIQAKSLIEEVDAEQQALANRIFVNGGTLVNIVQVARRKAEREKALQKAKDAVAEIDATGVQVKDLDIGLLDFPCVVGEEVILLCWKLGEKKITYWHGMAEGFAGRKPIDERILRGQKRSN